MNKSIKQLADELNISKQALRKHIKKLPVTLLSTGCRNEILINDEGQALLKDMVATRSGNQSVTLPHEVTTLIDELKNQIKEKDEQIKQLHQLLNQSQQLLKLEQDKKKSFLYRLTHKGE